MGRVNTGVEGPFLKTQYNDRGRQTGGQDAGSKRDDQGDTSTSGRLRGRPVLPGGDGECFLEEGCVCWDSKGLERERGTEQRETAEPRGTHEPDPGGGRRPCWARTEEGTEDMSS